MKIEYKICIVLILLIVGFCIGTYMNIKNSEPISINKVVCLDGNRNEINGLSCNEEEYNTYFWIGTLLTIFCAFFIVFTIFMITFIKMLDIH